MNFLLNILRGAVIGVANVIPGVSGGTMAVVMNVYDKLIGAVGRFFQAWKKNLLFLLPIALGAGAGIFLFGSLLTFLLERFPMAVNFFFIGLILGSVPMIFRRATAGGFRAVHLIPCVLAAGGMVALAILAPEDHSGVITQLSVPVFFEFLLGGAVGAVAMLLPGVSGSMMLVIFGLYKSVMAAISDLNIPILIPVAIGVLLGLLGGARIIDFFLRRFPQGTFWLVLGLIVGSLLPVYQESGFAFTWEGLASLLLLIVGAGISLLFSSEQLKARLESRKSAAAATRDPSESEPD